MRSADREVMLLLDDLEKLVSSLRTIYPSAAASADSVKAGASATGVPVRSSGISDPTGDAATDPRRRRRHDQVKKARREVKAAVTAAGTALSHATRAAEK